MNEPTRSQKVILSALQDRPIYGGTVAKDTIERRRAANKVAKRSRRKNRR